MLITTDSLPPGPFYVINLVILLRIIHSDGSWPGSGIVDGAYVDDAFGGEQNSKLTFLIYLNGDGDFEGGSTTFFLPGEECGHIEARAVHPQRGAVLVFPHGEVTSPVHEGSEISEGHQKYVIRTDVLYRSTINVAGS